MYSVFTSVLKGPLSLKKICRDFGRIIKRKGGKYQIKSDCDIDVFMKVKDI